MPKKAKPVNLDAVLKQFTHAFIRAGLGITHVGKTPSGIKVVVKTVASASKLPTEFCGVPVTVYQDLGPAGEKLLMRDKDGKVTGFQG